MVEVQRLVVNSRPCHLVLDKLFQPAVEPPAETEEQYRSEQALPAERQVAGWFIATTRYHDQPIDNQRQFNEQSKTNSSCHLPSWFEISLIIDSRGFVCQEKNQPPFNCPLFQIWTISRGCDPLRVVGIWCGGYFFLYTRPWPCGILSEKISSHGSPSLPLTLAMYTASSGFSER